MNQKIEAVAFGGGCFWCTEAIFTQLNGVMSVMPGYAGGNVPNPTYPMVCTGRTGHAEVVEVKYDPTQINFDDLLTVFFGTHDPTTLNRQGADIGTVSIARLFCTRPTARRPPPSALSRN